MAKAISKFIYERIICKYGYPKVLQNDQKTHFVNKVIADLIEKFRIKHYLSLPYHLQINDFVKRFNQILCEKLAKLADEMDQQNEFVDFVLMAYYIIKHSVTGIISFLLVYGREVMLPIDEIKLPDNS